MKTAEALRIIQSLANGQDPFSGAPLPRASPYHHPDIVRALFAAAQALGTPAHPTATHNGSELLNRGKAWTADEDRQLSDAFDAKIPIRQLARFHQRSRGAIEARLARLGKLVPELGHHPAYPPLRPAEPRNIQ